MPFCTNFLKFLGPTPGIVSKSGFTLAPPAIFALLCNFTLGFPTSLLSFTPVSLSYPSSSSSLSSSSSPFDGDTDPSPAAVWNQAKRDPLRVSLKTVQAR
uniref:Uncharacterized protein n=1 Tax=Opuntia streptacantha TaxID=393608 RepID=A0A7C9D9V5_OPUST